MAQGAGGLVGAHRRVIAAAIVMAVVAAGLTVLLYLVFVRTRWGQELDGAAFRGRGAVAPEVTRRTDRLLGTVSVTSLFLLGGSVVLVALARGRLRLAVVTGAWMSASVLTAELLKLVVLDRPAFPDVGGIPANSYPSGHATIAMTLALGMVMVAPTRLRVPATLAAAGGASAFGIAVLASGWHRPSDSLGAFAVALAWGATGVAVLAWWEGRPAPGRRRSDDRPIALGYVYAAGVVALALVTIVVVVGLRTGGLRTVAYARAYVLAALVIGAAGVASPLVFARLVAAQRRSRGVAPARTAEAPGH